MIKFRTSILNILCYFHVITYYEMWDVVNGSKGIVQYVWEQLGNKIGVLEYIKTVLFHDWS